MIKGYWFTTIGTNSFAASNTIWAAYHQYKWMISDAFIFRLVPGDERPDQQKRLNEVYNQFTRWIERFGRDIGSDIRIHTIESSENSYREYDQAFIKALKDNADKPRAIDITPGRKYASARGMAFGIIEKVEHIFYLHLYDDAYLSRPLPEIPSMLYNLQDFARK